MFIDFSNNKICWLLMRETGSVLNFLQDLNDALSIEEIANALIEPFQINLLLGLLDIAIEVQMSSPPLISQRRGTNSAPL